MIREILAIVGVFSEPTPHDGIRVYVSTLMNHTLNPGLTTSLHCLSITHPSLHQASAQCAPRGVSVRAQRGVRDRFGGAFAAHRGHPQHGKSHRVSKHD